MPLDDRTTNRSYKLPNPANFLSDDVGRLRDALTAIDADVAARPTQTQVDALITGLINGAPGALNTLQELAAALGNDPNFATTITTALSNRYTKTESDARYVQGVNQVENLFTGTGSQTVFTLSQAAASRESVLLSVGGVIQPVANYSVTGTTLTLSEAPASGVSIRALLLGVTGPALSAATLNLTQAGAGALSRSVETKLRELPSIADYSSLAAALAANNIIELPPGTFELPAELIIPRDGIRIRGAGQGRTIIRCAATMTSGHAFVLAGRNDCSFEGFTLDCNAGARGLASGFSGFNGFNVQGDRNSWINVEIYGSPSSGLLIDGNTITSAVNRIDGCTIRDNGGVGLSLNNVKLTQIIGNRFYNNGYENLTVDCSSNGTMAIKNYFFRHRGGCGNIGWDDGDVSLFVGNYIDSESTTWPAVGTRNGITINSEAGVTTGALISSNIILNNQEYGIILRNRSGQSNPTPPPNWNPSKPGDAMITGNYLRNNLTADIRIEDSNELVVLGHNNYQTIQIADPDAGNVRLPAGDIVAELNLTSQQVIAANTYTRVIYNTTVALRGLTASGGIITVPCGGFYAIDAKVRMDVGLTGITTVQIRIVTPSGNRVTNATLAPNQSVIELDCSVTKYLQPGEIKVEAYAFGTGNVTLLPGSENWFSCALVG